MAAEVASPGWQTEAASLQIFEIWKNLRVCAVCDKKQAKQACRRCKASLCNRRCETHHKARCGELQLCPEAPKERIRAPTWLVALEATLEYLCQDVNVLKSRMVCSLFGKWYGDESKRGQINQFLSQIRMETFKFRIPEAETSCIEIKSENVGPYNIAHSAFNFCHTGPLTACFLLTALLSRDVTAPLHGEMLALNCFIYFNVCHKPKKVRPVSFGYSIGPDDFSVVELPIWECLRLGSRFGLDAACVYLIILEPSDWTNHIRTECRLDDPKSMQTYRLDTSLQHLLLIRRGQFSTIIQSYNLHYTYRQWCNFSQELERLTDAAYEPVAASNFHVVKPQCRYRGIFGAEVLSQLCRDLESLTQSGDHLKVYADLTGIELQHSIPEWYQVRYLRLDLQRIPYI